MQLEEDYSFYVNKKKKDEAELRRGSFTFPRSLLFFFCPEFFFKESSSLRKTVSTTDSGNSETI